MRQKRAVARLVSLNSEVDAAGLYHTILTLGRNRLIELAANVHQTAFVAGILIADGTRLVQGRGDRMWQDVVGSQLRDRVWDVVVEDGHWLGDFDESALQICQWNCSFSASAWYRVEEYRYVPLGSATAQVGRREGERLIYPLKE